MQSFFEFLDFRAPSALPMTCKNDNHSSHSNVKNKLTKGVQASHHGVYKDDQNSKNKQEQKVNKFLRAMSSNIQNMYEKYPVLVNRYKCYDEIKKSVDELYPYLRDQNKKLRNINNTVERRKKEISIRGNVDLDVLLRILNTETQNYDETKINTFKTAIRKLAAQNKGTNEKKPSQRSYANNQPVTEKKDYHDFINKIRSDCESLLPYKEEKYKEKNEDDYVRKHYKSLGAINKKRDEYFKKMMRTYEQCSTYVESDGVYKELQELAKTSLRPENIKGADLDKVNLNNYQTQTQESVNTNVYGVHEKIKNELETNAKKLLKIKQHIKHKRKYNPSHTEKNLNLIEGTTGDVLTLNDIEKYLGGDEPIKKDSKLATDVTNFLQLQVEEAIAKERIEKKVRRSTTLQNPVNLEKLTLDKSNFTPANNTGQVKSEKTHNDNANEATADFLDQLARQNHIRD